MSSQRSNAGTDCQVLKCSSATIHNLKLFGLNYNIKEFFVHLPPFVHHPFQFYNRQVVGCPGLTWVKAIEIELTFLAVKQKQMKLKKIN